MTFAVSPGVSFSEFDLTLTAPAVAATPACHAGIFRWGPFNLRTLLGSKDDLLKRFYQPSNLNGETWFTAYSYLSYGGQLWEVRTGDVHGNAITQSHACTSTQSFEVGNTSIALDNTAEIEVGMKLFYSSNAALSPNMANGVYVTAVNSTAVTLTSSPTANANAVSLTFRSNIFYTAVAQENQDLSLEWADNNVLNANDYYNNHDGEFDPSVLYVAKYPGQVGNTLRVAVCDTAAQYKSNTNLQPNAQINATATFITANVGANTLSVVVTPADTTNTDNVTAANVVAGAAKAALTVGDQIQMGNTSVGFQIMKVSNVGAVGMTGNVFSFTINTKNDYVLIANSQSNTIARYWEFYHLVGVAPGQSQFVYNNGNTSANDQLHVVVVDQDGMFSGNPGQVLEVYKNVSRARDAQNINGTTNYYANVINQQSAYIWWANDRLTALSGNAVSVASSTATAPLNMDLKFGDDGLGESNCSIGTIAAGFNFFTNPEDVDVGLIVTGKNLGTPIDANTQLSTYLLNNIATVRRDCVVFFSPDYNSVVNNPNGEADAIIAARDTMPLTSYGFMDSGYKYMYDQFNNVDRWVPLNGDCAGLASLTDHNYAPWWAFSGFNRGQIKNIIKLAWNPNEANRDRIYPVGVNPVVNFKELGTVLYGDRTLFVEPSAFSRINVRRLFIVLEKSISTAAKFMLFEFNDDFTRAQFVALVKPFLQNVKSRRGITDFKVRCDDTNNTPWVIQNNQFIADIFIKPNYVIDWIQLNFVNVPPTISFEEAEGIQF